MKIKKGSSASVVNHLFGRAEKDSFKNWGDEFDRETRLAFASVSNELLLSKRIKKLVSGSRFQQLAREMGFSGMGFAEPILGIVDRDHLEDNKLIVYPRVKGVDMWDVLKLDEYHEKIMGVMTEKLRALFIKNGIQPNDLKSSQFIIDNDNRLVLIDIEAYTEINSVSQETGKSSH